MEGTPTHLQQFYTHESTLYLKPRYTIQIYSKTSTSRTIVLDVFVKEPIENVKEIIFGKENIHPEAQSLWFDGELLDKKNGRFLSDYEIKENSTINQIIKACISPEYLNKE